MFLIHYEEPEQKSDLLGNQTTLLYTNLYTGIPTILRLPGSIHQLLSMPLMMYFYIHCEPREASTPPVSLLTVR